MDNMNDMSSGTEIAEPSQSENITKTSTPAESAKHLDKAVVKD